jgi:hypothetical protein
MERRNRWKVVLDAETAPACGDWVAISGMGPADEEVAHFLFVDGTQAQGFTFVERRPDLWHSGPSIQEKLDARADGTALWMHFQDCVEIVGVEPLDWRPPTWPHDRPLWLLIVESLPTNIQFEKRLFDEHARRKAEARRGLGKRLAALVSRLAAPQVR